MSDFSLDSLYALICDRRQNPKEGSYTTYLFDKGLDKILKKVGEEATEVIIAGKAQDKKETIYEIADLAYHLLVLVAHAVSLAEILELGPRHRPQGKNGENDKVKPAVAAESDRIFPVSGCLKPETVKHIYEKGAPKLPPRARPKATAFTPASPAGVQRTFKWTKPQPSGPGLSFILYLLNLPNASSTASAKAAACFSAAAASMESRSFKNSTIARLRSGAAKSSSILALGRIYRSTSHAVGVGHKLSKPLHRRLRVI